MGLSNFDVKDFLANYWQKKPLVIRQAFAQADWLSPDELAGLACEEEVESRIIMQQAEKWSVEHGPFPEARFESLPKTHWTLLVQGVDQWVPEVADILRAFTFLPAWRLDDIMVSYAPQGGTVSQHFDFFDVFLIQGEGSRTWQVGDVCNSDSAYLPDTPVRILKDFTAQMEVTLMPGDVLYIPAKYSHYGVSVEDSLTYSVGFRAPSIRDVVDGVSTASLEHLLEDSRYQDSVESLNAQRGEIPADAIKRVQAMLIEAISDERLVSSWLGQYVTERKYPEHEVMAGDAEDALDRLMGGEVLVKHPASRFAYVVKAQQHARLYVDGQEYETAIGLADYLANCLEIDSETLVKLLKTSEEQSLLADLIRMGALIFEDEFYGEEFSEEQFSEEE